VGLSFVRWFGTAAIPFKFAAAVLNEQDTKQDETGSFVAVLARKRAVFRGKCLLIGTWA
jgi:hypothetical protein